MRVTATWSVILVVNRMLLTLSGRSGTWGGVGQRISGRAHGRGMMIPCACVSVANSAAPIKDVNKRSIFIDPPHFVRIVWSILHLGLKLGLKPGFCAECSNNLRGRS